MAALLCKPMAPTMAHSQSAGRPAGGVCVGRQKLRQQQVLNSSPLEMQFQGGNGAMSSKSCSSKGAMVPCQVSDVCLQLGSLAQAGLAQIGPALLHHAANMAAPALCYFCKPPPVLRLLRLPCRLSTQHGSLCICRIMMVESGWSRTWGEILRCQSACSVRCTDL